MKPTVYTKNVLKTLSHDKLVVDAEGNKIRAKGPKHGIRQVLRKAAMIDVAHGIIGFKTETGEILMGMQPYLLGFQLSDAQRKNLEEELGDALYFLTVVHKRLKIRVPPSARKHKIVKQTYTEALLNLDAMANEMLNCWKKVFYGKQVDYEKVSLYAKEAMGLLYAIAGSVLDRTPAQIMEGNVAKLAQRYPEGFFTQDAEANRDKEAEIAEMTKASTKSAKPVIDQIKEKAKKLTAEKKQVTHAP